MDRPPAGLRFSWFGEIRNFKMPILTINFSEIGGRHKNIGHKVSIVPRVTYQEITGTILITGIITLKGASKFDYCDQAGINE